MSALEDRVRARIEAGDGRPLREIMIGETLRAAPRAAPAAPACPGAAAVAAATREVARLREAALRSRDVAAAARIGRALDALEHARAALSPAAPARRRATVPVGLLAGRWSGGAR